MIDNDKITEYLNSIDVMNQMYDNKFFQRSIWTYSVLTIQKVGFMGIKITINASDIRIDVRVNSEDKDHNQYLLEQYLGKNKIKYSREGWWKEVIYVIALNNIDDLQIFINEVVMGE